MRVTVVCACVYVFMCACTICMYTCTYVCVHVHVCCMIACVYITSVDTLGFRFKKTYFFRFSFLSIPFQNKIKNSVSLNLRMQLNGCDTLK